MITSGALATDTVTAGNIVAGTITREKLANGTIPSEIGIGIVPSAIAGTGSTWDQAYGGINYKFAGYYQISIPEQYKPSTTFTIRVSWAATVSATRSSGTSNLYLYFYKNNSTGSQYLGASSVATGGGDTFISTGGANPSTYNKPYSTVFDYVINPTTWDTEDDNYIVAVIGSDFTTGPSFAVTNISYTINIK